MPINNKNFLRRFFNTTNRKKKTFWPNIPLLLNLVGFKGYSTTSLKFTFTKYEVSISRKQYFTYKMLRRLNLENWPQLMRHFRSGGVLSAEFGSSPDSKKPHQQIFGIVNRVHISGNVYQHSETVTKTIFGGKVFQWNGSTTILRALKELF